MKENKDIKEMKNLILDNVVYRITGQYSDRKDFVSKKFLDMSVYYMVNIETPGRVVPFLMNKNSMEKYGISFGSLDSAAYFNSKQNILFDRLDHVLHIPDDSELCPLCLLTNEDMKWGSSIILYPEVLGMIAEQMDSDFFILPSSVHELLVLPDNDPDWTEDTLQEILKEVNRSKDVIMEQEVLTDSIYRFDRDAGKVEIAKMG